MVGTSPGASRLAPLPTLRSYCIEHGVAKARLRPPSPAPFVQRRAIEPVDAARVAFEYLAAVLVGERQRIDVELRIVIVAAGERIDAAHRADHFGGEQD